ncbi:MAG: hypothetical protein AB1925_21705 [Actinomycetota bacterium]
MAPAVYLGANASVDSRIGQAIAVHLEIYSADSVAEARHFASLLPASQTNPVDRRRR